MKLYFTKIQGIEIDQQQQKQQNGRLTFLPLRTSSL